MDATRPRVHPQPVVRPRRQDPAPHHSRRAVPGGRVLTGAHTSSTSRSRLRPEPVSPLTSHAATSIAWQVAVATAVAIVLRLIRLGHQSLWIDELLTWSSAGIGSRLSPGDLLENVHGPIYSLLLHVWCGRMGDSEWAMRLPSALFGAALVPTIAWLATRWPGRDTAVPAAWLAAGSPFLVWYSQEARNYALLMWCATLAGVALLALRRRPRAPAFAGYVLAAGAGLLSNFSFALLMPLHLRWWLAESAGRAKRVVWLGAAILGLAMLVFPWVPQAARIWDWQRLHPAHAVDAGTDPLRGATTFHAAALPYAAYAFAAGYTLGPSLRELRANPGLRTLLVHAPAIAAVTLVFGPLLVAGMIALRRRGRLGEALLWIGVPALVVSYFAFRNFKVFHPRYLAVAYPAFVLLLAAGFADLPRAARRVAALAVALIWAVSLAHHYFVPAYGKEDYRGAAALVREHGRADERLLAVNAEEPMLYYYRGPIPQGRLWLGFARNPERLERKLDEALAGASGTWVVLSRPEDLDPRGVFAGTIARRHPEAERFELEGVQVWHIRSQTSREGAAGRS